MNFKDARSVMKFNYMRLRDGSIQAFNPHAPLPFKLVYHDSKDLIRSISFVSK